MSVCKVKPKFGDEKSKIIHWNLLLPIKQDFQESQGGDSDKLLRRKERTNADGEELDVTGPLTTSSGEIAYVQTIQQVIKSKIKCLTEWLSFQPTVGGVIGMCNSQ